ncbi:transcriptional regulator [Candidatus Pacearchaeota archaeon]|nr:transcriptional regulator [Candidatus Pacearchaeota archaeon]
MSLKLMPQELEVWYLLPALRKELTKMFIGNYDLSQREVSDILGITESAVSQYLKSKRAKKMKFSNIEMNEIKKAADRIVRDKKNSDIYLYDLSKKLRGSQCMCDVHRKHDKHLPHDCSMCRD